LQVLTLEISGLAQEVQPHFKEVEEVFSHALNILIDNNVKVMEQSLHEAEMKLFIGMRWKSDLSDNLKRIKEADKSNPDHPVNSKLRRKLLSVDCM
jgi:hypothetical protein